MAVHNPLQFMINISNQQIKDWNKPQTFLEAVLGKLKVCFKQQIAVNCRC